MLLAAFLRCRHLACLALIVNALLPTLCLASETQPAWLEVKDKGLLQTAGITWRFGFYSPNWKLQPQQEGFLAKEEKRGNGVTWTGPFRGRGKKPLFQLTESVNWAKPEAVRVEWQLKSTSPIEARAIVWEAALPVLSYSGQRLRVDDKEVVFPKEASAKPSLLMKRVKNLTLPVEGGELTLKGPFQVQLLDRRSQKDPHFYVRLFLEPRQSPYQQAKLATTLSFQPYPSEPLNLAPIAQRTFADEVAGDGKGGWTDQGPQNDLSAFNAAELEANNLNFAIPKEGPTAVVLSQREDRAPTKKVDLPIQEAGLKGGNLYLLHAGAYLGKKPVGKLSIQSSSGPKEITIEPGQDVNDWWKPAPSENAAVAWSGNNESARVGLYLSRFSLPDEPIESISFEASGPAVWMIAGAAWSPQAIPLPRQSSYFSQADDAWHPFDDSLEIEAGSILDFAETAKPQPAGSKGALITTPEGHFAFAKEPNRRVKIWGSALNFDANFLGKKETDWLAKRFRQMGYNSVRFHHHDVLIYGSWQVRDGPQDAKQRDRLDYMFYRFKEEGLSIATELYTMRRVVSSEVRKFMGDDFQLYKALVPFYPPAMEDWKRFAREFLTHKNPYTGLTWAEDPALVAVCPVNEDTLWIGLKKPKIRQLAEQAFAQWLKEKKAAPQTEAERTRLFNRFIVEKHQAADREMRRYLKEELGLKALVTGNNWQNFAAQVPIRQQYDYVDNHAYWDHPSFHGKAFQFPANFSHKSATATYAEVPRRLFLARIMGKPYAVTEFNYSMPNRFRNEGGALMGAYAARQDWDLLYRFAWTHSAKGATKNLPPSQAPSAFDLTADPINRLSEAFIGMLWYRGDLKPFAEEATYWVGEDAYDGIAAFQHPEKLPEQASLLGLLKKIGTRYVEGKVEPGRNAEFDQIQRLPRFEAGDDEARTVLEKSGDFLVETPKSKAIVLQTKSLDPALVSSFSGGSASILVASRDGQPLAESKRILVLHLTDVIASDMEFDSPERFSIKGPGKLPFLVRKGTAQLHLPTNLNQKATAYAVGMDGKRLGQVPLQQAEGKLTLELNTVPKEGKPRMVYEIVREG